MNPGISVVIPAYNEERFLEETLSSIHAARVAYQEEIKLPIEIIVVNNASTDGTKELALSLGARVVDHEKRNIASVRNAGIKAAIYDLIVTVDADSFVPKNAFLEIWRVMATGQYVGGGVRTSFHGGRVVMKALIVFVDRIILHGFGVSAGMFFFWKAAAERVRGFPEEFMVGEDVAFARLLKKDARQQGLKFCNLNSVRLLTKDRKTMTPMKAISIIWHGFRHLFGKKVTREELGYWYDPDR